MAVVVVVVVVVVIVVVLLVIIGGKGVRVRERERERERASRGAGEDLSLISLANHVFLFYRLSRPGFILLLPSLYSKKTFPEPPNVRVGYIV